jgi:hypothetical protein
VASNQKRICFVIGPMGSDDTDRLHALARDIVAPLLEELQEGRWTVRTPDLTETGKIMDQVIRELDRSELVVADISQDRPSVFYELAIRHCLARPYVMLRDVNAAPSADVVGADDEGRGSSDHVAFDIADYRWWNVDLSPNHQEAAKGQLRNILRETVDLIDADASFDQVAASPLTNYYRAPLTEVSAGAGLAYGYFNNFVRPVADALREPRLDWGERGSPFETEWWNDVKLHIFLPRDLSQANREAIDGLTKGLPRAALPAPTRPIWVSVFPWSEGCDGTLRLFDVPTTMGAIYESVRIRAGDNAPMSGYPWTWLERQEFARFRAVFNTLWKSPPGETDGSVRNLLAQHAAVEGVFDISKRIERKNWEIRKTRRRRAGP